MNLCRTFLTVLLSACVCTTLLHAQAPLTLEQARASALANSRTLRKALLSVDSAQLTEKIQSYAFLPSISASASGTASYPATSSTTGASVSYSSTTLANALQGTVGLSVSQTDL